MVFRLKGDEPLSTKVDLRVTPAEKDRLREDAESAGLSVSELVRRRYFGRPIIPQADLVMVRELHRLGGLLKHLHNQTSGIYSRDTAATLAEIRSYISSLRRDR